MTEPRVHRSRRWGRAWMLPGLLGLAACGSIEPLVRDVEGVPCVTFRKTHRPNRICAAQPAPSAAVEREVKSFAPDPGSGQVFVQWWERAGATRPLTLLVDGQAAAELVPGGLVRVRLAPGAHQLAVAWSGQQAVLPLQVRAGAVQIAEVRGRFKFWDVSFGWEVQGLDHGRARASTARVIADVDLRRRPAESGGSVPPSR